MAELGCCRSDLLLVFGLCSARNWPDIPETVCPWPSLGTYLTFPTRHWAKRRCRSASSWVPHVVMDPRTQSVRFRCHDLGTVVGRELHGCCALVSAGGCGDGGQVLTCSGNVHCMIAFCPKTERYK